MKLKMGPVLIFLLTAYIIMSKRQRQQPTVVYPDSTSGGGGGFALPNISFPSAVPISAPVNPGDIARAVRAGVQPLIDQGQQTQNRNIFGPIGFNL